jgi:UDPglucose 6-dehydrogenase
MAVELCNWLISQGASVFVHDPVAKALPQEWSGKVSRADTPLEAVRSADALVISTEWPEYKEISELQIVQAAPGITVLDANRFMSRLSGIPEVRYIAVGTPGPR